MSSIVTIDYSRDATEVVAEFASAVPEWAGSDPDDSCDMKVCAGKVEFHDVSFSYNSQKEVIKRVNFKVLPGQIVVLVGDSGRGKSTLFNLLCRFFDPKEGAITINDQDLRSVKLSSVRDAIGVVPQEPALVNRSILENLEYANPDATYEEVEEVCRAAVIHDKIESFPAGCKSTVGERGVKLSGGERQRTAIARALLKRPKIVLLDEATSAVDSSTEVKIQEAFRNLEAGRTMIVIAHRLSTIMNADQILVIVDGEIIEAGHHQQRLEKQGKYYELWDNQTKKSLNNAKDNN